MTAAATRPTAIDPAAPCQGCGCEPEILAYLVRAGVRVGYQCSCGTVVCDGFYQGSSPLPI